MDNLLAEQNFTASTDVLTSLGGTLVLTSLQANNSLAGLQLFFSEVAFAFISGLGAQEGTFEFRVFVALYRRENERDREKAISMIEKIFTIYFVILTARPKAKMVLVTWAISFFSHKSTVWKTSISGTPYSFKAFWKLLMFSIILN